MGVFWSIGWLVVVCLSVLCSWFLMYLVFWLTEPRETQQPFADWKLGLKFLLGFVLPILTLLIVLYLCGNYLLIWLLDCLLGRWSPPG